MTSVVVRAMSRTQSWCSQKPSMNTWSSSRVAGRGVGTGICQHQEVRRLKAQSSPWHSWAWLELEVTQEMNSAKSAVSWLCGPDRLRVLRPGAELVATVVEALQVVHFQRCAPAAVRPDFFIAVRQAGPSLARGERDLTRYTISPECQQPGRITGQNQNHPDFHLLFQRKIRS